MAARKLTDEQKIEIVEKYKTGNYTCSALSVEYGVLKSSIIRMLRYRNVLIKLPPGGQRKYSLNEDCLDEIDSEEKAYFLGFFYADGCNSSERNIITIALEEKDKSILEKFQTIVNSNRPLLYIKSKEFGTKKQYTRRPQWVFTVSSKKMSSKLTELGCPKAKSLILKFPSSSQVPDKLLKDWLRGFWDGDGTFTFTKNKSNVGGYLSASIATSLDVCENLKIFLEKKLHITSSISPLKNTKVYLFRIGKTCDSIKFLNWLYENQSICLERKLIKYQSICKELFIRD